MWFSKTMQQIKMPGLFSLFKGLQPISAGSAALPAWHASFPLGLPFDCVYLAICCVNLHFVYFGGSYYSLFCYL
jgi:hypothetical protein